MPLKLLVFSSIVKNDTKLKKNAYNTWKIKERYNVVFNPKTSFYFAYKNEDKLSGVVITNCTVRSFAFKRKHDACIQ